MAALTDMTDGRPPRLLIVSQFVPSGGVIAPRRITALTKYLARRGHRVTVLTSPLGGSGEIEGAAEVVRASDLVTTRLNWRRGHLESLKGSGSSEYSDRPSRLASVVVPDLALLTWTPFALRAASKLAARQTFDCVLTTSPPESAHFVGLALQRRGLPWVAELRDGWVFETTHVDWPLRIQHTIDRRLERLVMTRADATVTVTDPITDDLRSRLGTDTVTVTNGFDPDEAPGPLDTAPGLDPSRFSLVHTGRMTFAGRSPKTLLDAATQLIARRPDLARRFELVFVGPVTNEERAMIDAPQLAGVARSLGAVERDRAIELQRAADALVVITGRARRSEATGKLFEYLATGSPILVVGDATAAADIVARSGAGVAAPADDAGAVGSALERIVTGEVQASGSVDDYSFVSLAARMERVFERAIERSRSRASTARG